MMGIAVFARRLSGPVADLRNLTEYARLDMGGDEVTVLYPSRKNVTKGNWAVVGHQPLDKTDDALLFHLIGGALYKGDEEIRRPATLDDCTIHPPVLATGPIPSGD